MSTDTKEVAPTAGIRFTVASRPQRRFAANQTVSNLAGATQFQPIPLPATGLVRKVALDFTVAIVAASAVAVVNGDGPFRALSFIGLSDASGQPIFQPISGFNLYLVNKYFPSGTIKGNYPNHRTNPMEGPEYGYVATSATNGDARFRLTLDFEQDVNTGYGCIPNLDSNASLQLNIGVSNYTAVFTGTTVSAATVSVRATQHYWALSGDTMRGLPVQKYPDGFGDFVQTRYETQTVSASAENIVPINNRGGLVKGMIMVSRAAGARVAFTAGSQVGLLYDNNAIDEGVTLEEWNDDIRRIYGYSGAAIAAASAYAPLTAGTAAGLEAGVLVHNFAALSGGRDTWLNTQVGTLLQAKVTPGSAATELQVITQLAQVKSPGAFYERV